MLISSRRSAQIGLLSAIVVMLSSFYILLVGGRDTHAPLQDSFDPQPVVEFSNHSPLKDQVVTSTIVIPR